MKILIWLAGLCAVLMATSAYPQGRVGDIYVGAAPGMVFYPELEEQTGKFENELRQEGHANINNFSSSTEDRAFAWSAFAGYNLNDDFALELGYLGSGEVNQSQDLTATFDGLEVFFDGNEVSFDAKVKMRRWSLYGALVRQVSLDSSFVMPFVKVGVRRWHNEIEGTGTLTIADSLVSVPFDDDDDNGLGLLLGGGLDVPITDAASFRIEYLYLPLNDDHGGDEHRAHLGAYYSF